MILLDTSVLIDLLRKRQGRDLWLQKQLLDGHTVAVSALNLAEVYAGMRPAEAARTEAFLSGFEVWEITAAIARRAGLLVGDAARKGRTLTIADMLVAATALEHNVPLATDNRKDFEVKGLTLCQLP